MAADTEPAPALQYLGFWIGDEQYAVEVLKVRQIIEYGRVARVPSTAPFIRGIINRSGKVVPVIDLGVKFGRDRNETVTRPCIVITEVRMESEILVVGLMVDSVTRVLDFTPEQVRPAPRFGTRVQAEFLRGMGVVDGGFVLLLDVDLALTAEEIQAATDAVRAGKEAAGGEAAALPEDAQDQ